MTTMINISIGALKVPNTKNLKIKKTKNSKRTKMENNWGSFPVQFSDIPKEKLMNVIAYRLKKEVVSQHQNIVAYMELNIPNTIDAFMECKTVHILTKNFDFVLIDETALGTEDEFFTRVTESIIARGVQVSPKLKDIVMPMFKKAKEAFNMLPQDVQKWLIDNAEVFNECAAKFEASKK